MKKLLIVLAVLALAVGTAYAARPVVATEEDSQGPSRATTVFWFDNMESGAPGWTHGDNTATAVPHFHVDTYMAYGGTGHSWWCGNFDYDANGGYGNSWTDLLKLPSIDWTGYTYPVLGYAFRCDSELTYDFSWAQAESGGAYVNLNRGYDGLRPWGSVGHYLGNKDNPAVLQFKFASDGAWSDQDGNDTVGGAFACDDINVFDYITMTQFFFDDVESGGLCTPAVPASAGDYWRLLSNKCKSYSNTRCWAICSPDTNFVQPNLDNWLKTPYFDITGAATCTFRFYRHVSVPTDDNDYWVESVTPDGGANWYAIGSYWGSHCDNGYAVCWVSARRIICDAILPGTSMAYRWTMHTTDDGSGPDTCNSAGIYIDDTSAYGYVPPNPVQESSWGKVKALYR